MISSVRKNCVPICACIWALPVNAAARWTIRSFTGNPGLGKTTLAQIMAAELGVNLVCTSGPVLERSGDLAAILTNLSRNDILFVDEIHRMPIAVEEVLYPAMEDFKLDLVIGQGRRPARSRSTWSRSPW